MNKEFAKLAAAAIVRNELSKSSGIFDWFTNNPSDYYSPAYVESLLNANVESMDGLGLHAGEWANHYAGLEQKREDLRPRSYSELVFGEGNEDEYSLGSPHGHRPRLLIEYAWDEETQSDMPIYGSSEHRGQDYRAGVGTQLYAPFGGEITSSHHDTGGGGNLSFLSPFYPDGSPSDLAFSAMHLAEPTGYERGDVVEPSDPWGLVGSTGRSSGPHLHAGAKVGDASVHPAFLTRKLDRLFDKYEEMGRYSPFTEEDFVSDDDYLYLN